MKRNLLLSVVVLLTTLLSGCATPDLGSPCPNFGAYCDKIPINSWDYGHSDNLAE